MSHDSHDDRSILERVGDAARVGLATGIIVVETLMPMSNPPTGPAVSSALNPTSMVYNLAEENDQKEGATYVEEQRRRR